MEVWGGNREVDKTFSMAGLSLGLRSRVFRREAAGGDIYLVSSCASGRITRTLLADVSGHGMLVSRVAAELRELLRQYVNVVSQNQLVAEVNRGFSRLADDGGFATAVVCTYFAPTRSLAVSNAGHPPPMLYRKKDAIWHPLADEFEGPGLANTPLGVASEATYSSPATKLEVGDMVLCYSDAWTEARDSDGGILGVNGLQKILNQLPATAPGDFLDALESQLELIDEEGLNSDDATALLLRVENTGATLQNSLLAPLRLFRRAHDNTAFAVPDGPRN